MPQSGRGLTVKRLVECTIFLGVVIIVFSMLETMFGQNSGLGQAPIQSQQLMLQSLQRRRENSKEDLSEEEDEDEDGPADVVKEQTVPPEPPAKQVDAGIPQALKDDVAQGVHDSADWMSDVQSDELPGMELGSASLDPEQVSAVRRGLGSWLLHVASFQEVETIQLSTRWLDASSAAEVNQVLDNLLLKDPEAGWVTCASENELCKCASGRVRYGHRQKGWYTKKGKEEIACLLDKFGKTDMAYGMLKTCQCHDPPHREVGVEDLAALVQLPSDPGGRNEVGAAPGTLWKVIDGLVAWIEKADSPQLLALSRVYQWMEGSGGFSKIGAAIAKAATKATLAGKTCEDGSKAELKRCPQYALELCAAACGKHLDLQKQKWRTGPPQAISEECRSSRVAQLWSCDHTSSRVPGEGHAHATAQHILDQSLQAMCDETTLQPLWQTFLDCDFLDQYLRWTSESGWVDEAFVTYVAGVQDSIYALQATNLVRSVDLFSSKPVIVVVFDEQYIPPWQWRHFPNVIVYKMLPLPGKAISFNFNKLRAMIASRTLVGVQLDTDQLIAPEVERMFAASRREIHSRYPWPMLPVHWMSRDAKKGELYSDMNFEGWAGQRTMRWGHAHPTWTYWALPFLADLLYERFVAGFKTKAKAWSIQAWDLNAASSDGLLAVMEDQRKSPRQVKYGSFMMEDEDMLNAGLWRDKATKEWCKFDLEWALFKERWQLDPKPMQDSKWYPDGVPVVYLSMHNTKQFEVTDWLLSWFARCHSFKPSRCPTSGKAPPPQCQEDSSAERKLRRRPHQYVEDMCCCMEPRLSKWIYWGGKWFDNGQAVPGKMPGMQKNRTCTLP
eukprot:s52_g8.t1